MDIEKRTITLNVTKRKLTEEEAAQLPPQTDVKEPTTCGPWFLESIPGYGLCTCRICYTGAPTSWPYKECVQLPS